jgi:hypothetical protein
VRRIGPEAPAAYVAFVARHLDPLRRDAEGVVGSDGDPDDLSTDVLTDVATRWTWLELVRRRLRRPGAAEAYLRHAFARRAHRWQVDHRPDEPAPVDIQVWRADRPPPPLWSSAALRLAPVVARAPRPAVRPVAEAGVAWWHAYDGSRRRRRIAVLVALCVLFFLLAVLASNA